MNLLRPITYFLIVIEVLKDVNCAILNMDHESNSDLNHVKNNVNGTRSYNASVEKVEPRKKKEEKDMMSKILPLMVMPFMISSSMIPMMLISLKFMLMKSALTGTIAIILLLVNMLRGRNDHGGVYSHDLNQKDVAMAHYGYGGDEEYGAYIHRRSFR